MKKLIITTLIVLGAAMAFSFKANAQEENKTTEQTQVQEQPKAQDLFLEIDQNEQGLRVYCEIVGIRRLFSSKYNVTIDFGQEGSWWFGRERILDERGKEKIFNSMIDALNYLSERGWELCQTYIVKENPDSETERHWILTKIIKGTDSISDGVSVRSNR